MNVTFLPKTKLGKWTVTLLLISLVLIMLGNCENIFHKDVGITIYYNPILFFAKMSGALAIITSAVLAIIAVIKEKEKSLLVYLSILAGLIIAMFIIIDLEEALNFVL